MTALRQTPIPLLGRGLNELGKGGRRGHSNDSGASSSGSSSHPSARQSLVTLALVAGGLRPSRSSRMGLRRLNSVLVEWLVELGCQPNGSKWKSSC
eukprot:g25605.t1